MTPRTPMGEAVVGGRLWRLAEGQRIIRELVAQGWLLRQIGWELGYRTLKPIADWRDGKRAPSAEQLAALRRLLGEDRP